MRIRFVSYVIAMLILGACVNNSQQAPKNYFDLSAFIDEQINLLKEHKGSLNKDLSISGTQEKLSIDSINWEKELAIFKTFDINFTKTKSPYSVVESHENHHSITHYSTPDQTGIIDLKIYRSNDKISRIEATRITANNVFSDYKTIGLNFSEDLKKETLLVGYCVKGGQKMIAIDSLIYHVDATVLLNPSLLPVNIPVSLHPSE